MNALEFKDRADAIANKARQLVAKAEEAFQQAREEAERWRRDELASLAEEFRNSMDEKTEGAEEAPTPTGGTPDLPTSKSGRLKRGVLDEILPLVAREIGTTFSKTALFERAQRKYPGSPIFRTSVNGAVDRLEAEGVMRKVSEEPEQVFVLSEWEAEGEDEGPGFGRVLSMRE